MHPLHMVLLCAILSTMALILFRARRRRKKDIAFVPRLPLARVYFASMSYPPNPPLSLDVLGRIAIHEAAHALIAWHFPTIANVHRVAIRAEKSGESDLFFFGGYTFFRCDPSKPGVVTHQLLITLAGIAAELRFRNTIPLFGARGDLAAAVEEAKALLARFPEQHGFDPHAGWDPAALSEDRLPFDALINEPLSPDVRGLLDAAFRRVTTMLDAREPQLHRLSYHLRKERVLYTPELRHILGTS